MLNREVENKILYIINHSELPVSEAYYIVENIALQLKILYLENSSEESNQEMTEQVNFNKNGSKEEEE